MAVTYTQKIDPNSPTGTIGVTANRGSVIVLDEYIYDENSNKECFKWLHIDAAGDVVVEGLDGNVIPYLGAVAGSLIPIMGFRVLASAVIDGDTYNTTATRITWGGGK